MDKTLLKDLESRNCVEEELQFDDEDELEEVIGDLSLPLRTRLRLLEKFWNSMGYDPTQEFINKISMMYQFSGTHLLEEYLYNIVYHTTIHIQLKIVAAKALCNFEDKDKLGFECINKICKNDEFVLIPTPLQVDVVKLLMNYKTYKKESTIYFCGIINDQKTDVDYRYKAILSLENRQDQYFIKNSCMSFIFQSSNATRYRILAGQYLLNKCKLPKTTKKKVEKILLLFSRDTGLDDTVRSDAADILLQHGSEANKKLAQDIIGVLGKQGKVVRSIFDNAQNVHTKDIDKSLYAGIEFLTQVKTWEIKNAEITFENINKEINEYGNENKQTPEEKEQIELALNRINMDRAIYKPYNVSLKLILIKVWSYIKRSEENVQKEILKCLIQELVAMAQWCSSGYATRLINSISGFGDFNYRISWKEQVVSNFVGRLNARARNIKDEDFQDKVLEEMAIDSSNYGERKHFLKFFRQNVLSIREEMAEEFEEHMDNASFDLAFKSAIISYEN